MLDGYACGWVDEKRQKVEVLIWLSILQKTTASTKPIYIYKLTVSIIKENTELHKYPNLRIIQLSNDEVFITSLSDITQILYYLILALA